MNDHAPSPPSARAALILAAFASSLLLGCASGPLRVNTDVQAFSQSGSTPTWQGARYRFDVLPSQSQLNLNPLHAMAEASLATHGLVRDEAQARYAVQISANVRTTWVDDGWGAYPAYPSMRPRGAWGWGVGVGYGFGPSFWGGGHFPPTSTYWRELRLAILDGQTRQTVYETRARSENPSGEHDAIFATMLKAALQDFPHTTAGWQPVTMEVPMASPAASAPSSAPASAKPAP